MHFTAAEIVMIIAAFSAMGVQLITAWRTSSKVGETFTKVAVIEGHVNSERSRSNEERAGLQKEIEGLRQVINDKVVTAALLAQALSDRENRNSQSVSNRGIEK